MHVLGCSPGVEIEDIVVKEIENNELVNKMEGFEVQLSEDDILVNNEEDVQNEIRDNIITNDKYDTYSQISFMDNI